MCCGCHAAGWSWAAAAAAVGAAAAALTPPRPCLCPPRARRRGWRPTAGSLPTYASSCRAWRRSESTHAGGGGWHRRRRFESGSVWRSPCAHATPAVMRGTTAWTALQCQVSPQLCGKRSGRRTGTAAVHTSGRGGTNSSQPAAPGTSRRPSAPVIACGPGSALRPLPHPPSYTAARVKAHCGG